MSERFTLTVVFGPPTPLRGLRADSLARNLAANHRGEAKSTGAIYALLRDVGWQPSVVQLEATSADDARTRLSYLIAGAILDRLDERARQANEPLAGEVPTPESLSTALAQLTVRDIRKRREAEALITAWSNARIDYVPSPDVGVTGCVERGERPDKHVPALPAGFTPMPPTTAGDPQYSSASSDGPDHYLLLVTRQPDGAAGGAIYELSEVLAATPPALLAASTTTGGVLDVITGWRFVALLRRRMTADAFKEMQARNARDPAVNTGDACHSHDFIDANMVMADAFSATYGRDPFTPVDVEDSDTLPTEIADADTSRMNRAWAWASRTRLRA